MQSFTELPLDADILETLAQNKYETPTPIQAETLPILLGEPTDFLGLAATGTGKTLAFGLPLAQKIVAKDRHPQALILCPTRELAQQVSLQIQLLGKSRRLNVATVFGGAGYGDQIKSLRAGAHVVVATPGRLVDHLERGTVNLSRVKTVILDEADEMISMGFKDDLELILSRVKEETASDIVAHAEGEDAEENDSARTAHIWLFSATMSADVKKVAHKFLKNPKTVQINSKTVLSGTVEQLYYMTKETDKPEILGKIIDVHDSFYGLVFCQTKLLVQSLTTLLQSRGYKVDSLHGDKPQTERERILARFRARDLQIVICTDVAARGLDVKDLTHVVNYSIPRELENYIHRIGRTGRSVAKGIAISLVTPSHLPLIGRIEKITRTKIDRGVVPSNADVAKKKVARIVTKFKAAQNWEKAQAFLEENFKEEIGEMSASEIFGRVLAVQHADLFQVRELRANKLMSTGESLGDHRARGIRPQQFDGRDRRPERREWTPSRNDYGASRPSFSDRGPDRGPSADRGPSSSAPRPFRSEGRAGGAHSESRSHSSSEGRPHFGSEGRSDRGGSSEGKRSFGTFRTFDAGRDSARSPETGSSERSAPRRESSDRPRRDFSDSPRRESSDARPARRTSSAEGSSSSAPRRERSSDAAPSASPNSRREFGERKFGARKPAESVSDRPRRKVEEGSSIRDKYKTRRPSAETEQK